MKLNPIPPGFKKKAENQSLEIRKKLGLSATVACPARLVAQLIGATVTPVQCLDGLVSDVLSEEFPDEKSVLNQLGLLREEYCGFSAIAVVIEDYKMILFNAAHSAARQESDIMHELAHLICGHPGDCLQQNALLGLRQYNHQHEEEAGWLGSAIQIPETGIFQLAKAGYSTQKIAEIYGSSVEMANYRRRVLAIDRRLFFVNRKAENRKIPI